MSSVEFSEPKFNQSLHSVERCEGRVESHAFKANLTCYC